MSRSKVVPRTKKIETKILERLDCGATITSICAAAAMPTIRSFQRWCRNDAEFSDRFISAWVRGMIIQHSGNRDDQDEAIRRLMNGDEKLDPKTAQALATLIRDKNHNIVAMLTRLDKRFSEKSEVSVSGPMIIGWENANENCPKCGHNMTDTSPVIEHIDLPEPETEPTGGEARV